MKNRYRIKRWFGAVTLLLLSAFATHLPATDGPGAVEEMDVKGLKVIFKPTTANEIISVQLYLKGGIQNLTEKNQGIEQLIFSSLTLMDRKYADSTWSKLFGGVGAEIGSRTGKEYTIVSLRCSRTYFDQLWGAFADYVLNSGFYDERVDIVKQKLLTALRRAPDHPDGYIRGLAEGQFYEGHQYHLTPYGNKETIPKIKMQDMASYLDDHLQKKRMLMVVVGNLNRESLRKKIADTFGKISKGKYNPKLPPPVSHDSSRVKVVERDLPTNYILGLFSAPPLDHEDYYPTVMAVNILKWRLFDEVRTKRNLSYAPDAFIAGNFANYGGVYATSVDPDSTVKIMLAELKKLKTEPVSKKDLYDRINMYLTQYYLNNESNSAQGNFLAQFELSGLGWQQAEMMIDEIRKVTAEDVQRVAKLYFKNLQFVYLGKPELIDEAVFTSM